MKKIKGPWTYRTALVTIDYGPGEHEVTNDIAAAFKERNDGSSVAEIATPGDLDGAQE